MKISRNTIIAFLLLLVVAALYRIIPNRPAGFAPQMALALFGGSMIGNKKWAIVLPLVSLLISDILYQVLYSLNLSTIPGFYAGQVQVYLVFVAITFFGFLLKKINFRNVALFSISGSLLFFLVSNFFVWLGNAGFQRPKTFEGLLMCYGDALAFYRDGGLIHGFVGNFILGDLIFCALLFGGYYLLKTKPAKQAIA